MLYANIKFKTWLEDKEVKQDKMRTMVDGQNLILFFTKNGIPFGAPEESRFIFAKMKEPKNDIPDNINFNAFDLMKGVENLFGKKDLMSIKIIDPEDAHDMLHKKRK